MTDTANTAPVESPSESPDNAAIVAEAVASQTPVENDFSFVLDKYRADGRTDQDAAFEQAKAYGELQSKFGAFTGAPEEYEVTISDDLKEKINLDDFKDDPLFQDYQNVAKEMGINNEGFNKLVDMYFKDHLAQLSALDDIRAEEMKALGKDAQRRLDNIEAWSKANLSAESSEALIEGLGSAKIVQAFEEVIAKTRNAPQVTGSTPAPAISKEDASKMLNATDEFGNPCMNNPEYRKKVEKIYDQLYGAEPHTVTVG